MRKLIFLSWRSLIILAIVLSVQRLEAGDTKPVPVPLAAGVNKGNVDNVSGPKYFSFWVGPGPVTINLAYKSLGIFGNPLRENMHFNLYTADGKLLNEWTLQSVDKLVRNAFPGDIPARTLYVLEVKAQDGGIRLGGYFEIEVTGAVDFGNTKNTTQSVQAEDTSLVHPGVQLTSNDADDGPSYPLMFRPKTVEVVEKMPDDLTKKYPNDELVVITFLPADHAANKTGSNLKEGQGAWMDRGIRPSEPNKIWLILPVEDMMPHTLKVSEGPFVFKVRNSGQGYFRTVPFVSPELKTIDE